MVRCACVVAAFLAWSVPAHAQSEADVLSNCLAENTSGKDRKDLATWVFLSMAAHPEIKQFASGTAPTASIDSARTMGALVTRLLTESCADQARAVFKTGGATSSFQLAFQKLGQLAMQELMTDKSVNESMGLFERYLDQSRFAKLRAGQ
jgi:hypothetical protein